MHSVYATCSSNHNQPGRSYVISRLVFVTFFVVITFIVYITQEFTFILNYNTYVTPSSTLQDLLVRHANITQANITWGNKFSGDDDLIYDNWLKVTDDVSVYSAYWDNRISNKSFVRIIGGAQISDGNVSNIKCLLRYNNFSAIQEVFPNSEILIEHHNKPSKAVYIKCFVNTEDSPDFVAVLPAGWNETWEGKPQWMAVHVLQNYSFTSIGVCVRPMFNYSDVFRISEFVSYYKALGSSHFTFYDYNVSVELINYLQALRDAKYSIDVLPWDLPSNLSSMWSVGQLASINDCIYRNLGGNMYIIIVDLDEFITPTHTMTLQEVLKIQDVPRRHAAAGSFVVRSSVFCSEYESDILPPVIPPFITQSDIYRENYVYPFLIRSKYIVKPYMVEMAGVHQVWRFLFGCEERFIPISQALVHHYRRELCVGKNKTLGKGTVDVKSRKYLNYLMRSKAVDVWKNLYG